MKRTYIITGADGHLGGALVRKLQNQDCLVRGLIFLDESALSAVPTPLPLAADEPTLKTPAQPAGNTRYYEGDVRRADTLAPLFEGVDPRETIVIHTAGIVDISMGASQLMRDVNVGGTKNLVGLCMGRRVKRLVYVSSVHAIPAGEPMEVITEVDHFSSDAVVGGYAKTKAEATQAVLDSVKLGLDAVVVHPSGIVGPYEAAGNHIVQMVKAYMRGRLPVCIRGGYDFVDVRDVAEGCLLAAEQGQAGSCYILSNRHYEAKDILAMVRQVYGGRRLPVLPIWAARMATPLLGAWSRLTRQRPLYTKYSLHALHANDRFSHDKATAELRYRPRDLRQTIADTVAWLKDCRLKPLNSKGL